MISRKLRIPRDLLARLHVAGARNGWDVGRTVRTALRMAHRVADDCRPVSATRDESTVITVRLPCGPAFDPPTPDLRARLAWALDTADRAIAAAPPPFRTSLVEGERGDYVDTTGQAV